MSQEIVEYQPMAVRETYIYVALFWFLLGLIVGGGVVVLYLKWSGMGSSTQGFDEEFYEAYDDDRVTHHTRTGGPEVPADGGAGDNIGGHEAHLKGVVLNMPSRVYFSAFGERAHLYERCPGNMHIAMSETKVCLHCTGLAKAQRVSWNRQSPDSGMTVVRRGPSAAGANAEF